MASVVPDELLIKIFSHCHPDDLTNINKLFPLILESNIFWRQYYEQHNVDKLFLDRPTNFLFHLELFDNIRHINYKEYKKEEIIYVHTDKIKISKYFDIEILKRINIHNLDIYLKEASKIVKSDGYKSIMDTYYLYDIKKNKNIYEMLLCVKMNNPELNDTDKKFAASDLTRSGRIIYLYKLGIINMTKQQYDDFIKYMIYNVDAQYEFGKTARYLAYVNKFQ